MAIIAISSGEPSSSEEAEEELEGGSFVGSTGATVIGY